MCKSEEDQCIYQEIIEKANIGIMIVQEGRIEFANPWAVKCLGCVKESLISQPVTKYVYPNDLKMVLERYEKRMKGEEIPFIYSARIVQENGTVIWIELNTVIINRNGQKASLVFFTDITNRKKTEEELDAYRDNLQVLVEKQTAELIKSNKLLKDEIAVRKSIESALRESEKKYRAILESIEEGYFEVDLKGNMIFFNESMCKIAGVPSQMLMGLNYREYTTSETAQKMRNAFKQVAATRVPIHEMDFEIIRKNGEKRILEMSISLVYDNDGNITGFRGIARDVTERRQVEERIRQSEKKYRLIAENTSDVIITMSFNLNIEYVSPSIQWLLGYSSEEVIQCSIGNMMEPEYYKQISEIIQEEIHRESKQIFDPKRFRKLELQLKRKDQNRVWAEITISLLRDENGKAVNILCVMRDITERKQSEEELAYLAYHDFLTNLYNRKAFIEKLDESLKIAKRYGIKRAIFYIDLDRFKQVNDTYGHEIGDKLLKQVANRLKSILRETDLIFRIGGDEFTVLLNNISDMLPEVVGKKIIEKLSEPYFIDSISIDYISSSIGVSIFPEDGFDLETLIKTADTAMYKAKEKGNRFIFYRSITS